MNKLIMLCCTSIVLICFGCETELTTELQIEETATPAIQVKQHAIAFADENHFAKWVNQAEAWEATNWNQFIQEYATQGFSPIDEAYLQEYEIPTIFSILNQDKALIIGQQRYTFNFETEKIRVLNLKTQEEEIYLFTDDIFAISDSDSVDDRMPFCPHISDQNLISYFGGNQMIGELRYQNFGIYHRLKAKVSKSTIDNAFSIYMYIAPGYATNNNNTQNWSNSAHGGTGSSYSEILYASTRRLIAYSLSADFMIYTKGKDPETFSLGISCGSNGSGQWMISEEAQGAWQYLNNSSVGLNQLVFGDFIGDEYTDILYIEDYNTFKVSDGGTSSWIEFTHNTPVSLSPGTVKVGDFVGTVKKELFSTWGGQWHAYNFSDQTWYDLASSGYGVNQVAIGDFIGNSRDDVFLATGQEWRASDGGVSNWQVIHGSNYTLGSLAFGDFLGDSKTDVFLATGSDWRIAESGQENWQVVNGSDYTLPYLKFGNFVGDAKTDVLRPDGTHWKVSESAQNNWQTINTSGYTVNQIKIGDFTGYYGKDEVFIVN